VREDERDELERGRGREAGESRRHSGHCTPNVA
jgi:hypothetical protein